MRALPSPSDTLRRLNPRERRVVLGGAIVSATALVVVLVALPFAHRWGAREAAYGASREQWVRLATLAASTDRLRRALDEQKLAHAADEGVDVAGQPRPDKPGLLAIPVQLQGQGDVYGLVDFLYRLQHGEKLLVLDELSLNAGFVSSFQGGSGRQYLSWSLRLHGLYGAAAAGTGS